MRAHYLQHVPFEGLGSIEPWLLARGCDITCTRLYETGEFPPVDDVDLLVIMGGPMSVNDEHRLPWLIREKAFVRAFIATGRPVLGICLGAQMIAGALGSRVYANPVPEIGWFPVEGIRREGEGIFAFPVSSEVFHWHGETFDLPEGAVRLARSPTCENQAFQLGPAVIGLQFHLETTPQTLREIVSACRDELVPSAFVQSEADILSASSEQFRAINTLMADVLDFLTRPPGQS